MLLYYSTAIKSNNFASSWHICQPWQITKTGGSNAIWSERYGRDYQTRFIPAIFQAIIAALGKNSGFSRNRSSHQTENSTSDGALCIQTSSCTVDDRSLIDWSLWTQLSPGVMCLHRRFHQHVQLSHEKFSTAHAGIAWNFCMKFHGTILWADSKSLGQDLCVLSLTEM